MRFFDAELRLAAAGLLAAAPPAGPGPGDAGAVAAACGATANPAFARAISGLELAPCLCCCRARNVAVAARAEAALALILRYFSQEAYVASGAHRFVASALAAPATPPALARQFRRSGRAAAGPVAKALNRASGVAAVTIGHPWQAGPRNLGAVGSAGRALVLAATPEARRLLRRVGKLVKIAVRPARPAETLLLRVRVNALVVDAYGTDLAGFAAAAKRAARKFEAGRRKGTSAQPRPPKPPSTPSTDKKPPKP